VTTPATGRIFLDYYNAHWTRHNKPRHAVPAFVDPLHPTVVVDALMAQDAGDYVVEVRLTNAHSAKMRHIVTVAAWSVCMAVCLRDTAVTACSVL